MLRSIKFNCFGSLASHHQYGAVSPNGTRIYQRPQYLCILESTRLKLGDQGYSPGRQGPRSRGSQWKRQQSRYSFTDGTGRYWYVLLSIYLVYFPDGSLDGGYDDALHKLRTRPKIIPRLKTQKEKDLDREDYYKNVRTNVLLVWVLTNVSWHQVYRSSDINDLKTGHRRWFYS